jgi:hypothetical protein
LTGIIMAVKNMHNYHKQPRILHFEDHCHDKENIPLSMNYDDRKDRKFSYPCPSDKHSPPPPQFSSPSLAEEVERLKQ